MVISLPLLHLLCASAPRSFQAGDFFFFYIVESRAKIHFNCQLKALKTPVQIQNNEVWPLIATCKNSKLKRYFRFVITGCLAVILKLFPATPGTINCFGSLGGLFVLS